MEKEMATHSSILARKIPRTEEPGGLQSMGSPRVGQVTEPRSCILCGMAYNTIKKKKRCQVEDSESGCCQVKWHRRQEGTHMRGLGTGQGAPQASLHSQSETVSGCQCFIYQDSPRGASLWMLLSA